MTSHLSQKTWLAYLIAAIGILSSVYLWFVLEFDTPAILAAHPLIEVYHAWIVLGFGISISVLVGVIIRFAQIAQLQTLHLQKVNENLTKEINERISAEKNQQKLEVALLQGQKLQAIGTLAGGIAHDFNNLLYAVIGYVEMAREDVDKDSGLYANLGKVLEAAHRGQELISRILAFSRRQHHQFDTLHLRDTIEAALALLRPTIPASVMIDFKPHHDAIILGNHTQIHQVLVNIINNAVDAMDGEGTITISIDHISSDAPIIKQFPEMKAQNYCKIEIQDTGRGMDQHIMERMYEPFFTTKEVGKGTGLGLSIVHSIIKEHQGEIAVSSQIGHGTTFVILLPEQEKS